MVRLLLARHGLSVGNVQLVFQGQTDMEIAPEGELQAGLLGRRLEGEVLQAVYTSDLQRAARTAEIAVAGRVPVVPDGAWREKAWGIWEGLNGDQIRARYPGQWEERQQDPVHWLAPLGAWVVLRYDLVHRLPAKRGPSPVQNSNIRCMTNRSATPMKTTTEIRTPGSRLTSGIRSDAAT